MLDQILPCFDTHVDFDETRLQIKQKMDSCDGRFFDAIGDTAHICDSESNLLECSSSSCGLRRYSSVTSSNQFDVWKENPRSVEARRSKFFNWLGLDVSNVGDEGNSIARSSCRSLSFESVCRSEFSESSTPREDFVHPIENSDGVCDHCKSSNISGVVRQPGCGSPSSSSSGGEVSPLKNLAMSDSKGSPKRVKKWWSSLLRNITCVAEGRLDPCSCDSSSRARNQRVKVHVSKKQNKELSALYYGQNIQAHKGAILTMKFSTNGQFLASAGEDRIARIWQVVEDDRLNKGDIPYMEPSCVFFRINDGSELNSLCLYKEKNGKLKMNSDSACVILPPKVFRIMEKPLYEFKGHTNEILDLSWSKNNRLLSSSGDKTVRLWQIGVNQCLKVFPHHSYVTCVQFNPINDDYFISGSVDGKVRIWEISSCKVVNWIEIKDIVTAVCYRPNGQGLIVGSITGSCLFYNIKDNNLQLDAKIFVHKHNKKKSLGKRITGFQFFSQDPSKVMVSCADSQVRIIQGVNVIGRYKGLKSSGTYSSAFFTSDGKHIVSATEDNNVYMWKCTDENYRDVSQVRKVKSSERFLSNASVALPWPGLRNERGGNKWPFGSLKSSTPTRRSFFSPAYEEFFSDPFCPKGSTLWPEEMLISSMSTSATQKASMHKSECKFLRTCQRISESNAWGLVIVTAGWDGKIRSFLNYGLPVRQ